MKAKDLNIKLFVVNLYPVLVAGCYLGKMNFSIAKNILHRFLLWLLLMVMKMMTSLPCEDLWLTILYLEQMENTA